MKAVKFNNTWESIQEICPINNAAIPAEWDKENGELIITTKSYAMVIKSGETVIFDDEGNAMCHLVNMCKNVK